VRSPTRTCDRRTSPAGPGTAVPVPVAVDPAGRPVDGAALDPDGAEAAEGLDDEPAEHAATTRATATSATAAPHVPRRRAAPWLQLVVPLMPANLEVAACARRRGSPSDQVP